jgi:hypothetical protein
MKTFIALLIVMFSLPAVAQDKKTEGRSAQNVMKKADKKKADKKPADKKAADKKKQGAVKPMTPEQQKNR